jgi:hypothetical protein
MPEIQNVKPEYSKDGKTLTLTIDTAQDFGDSSTKRSRIVASTRGWADLGGKLKLTLVLIRVKG